MYSKQMQLADAMWKELEPIFDVAIKNKEQLVITFKARRLPEEAKKDWTEEDFIDKGFEVAGKYADEVKKAVRAAEVFESKRRGELVQWDLRTIHYVKKHVVAHGNIDAIHVMDNDTTVMFDWLQYYEFRV